MSVLGSVGAKLADKAGDAITANSGSWVDKAVAAANTYAKNAGSPIATQSLLAGAVVLRDNAGVFGDLAAEQLHDVAHHLAIGDEGSAYRAWLEASATTDQRFDAEEQAHVATQTDTAQKAQRWSDLRSATLRFLAAAGQAAFPILLAALVAV